MSRIWGRRHGGTCDMEATWRRGWHGDDMEVDDIELTRRRLGGSDMDVTWRTMGGETYW